MRVGDIAAHLRNLPQNAEITVTVGGQPIEGAWSFAGNTLAFDGVTVEAAPKKRGKKAEGADL